MTGRPESACEEILGLLGFYMDDELEAAERERVDAHVRACAFCARVMAADREFLGDVRAAGPLATAPPALRASIEGILVPAPVPHVAPAPLRERIGHIVRSGRRPWWRPANVAAAAVLVAVVAGLVWVAARAVPNVQAEPSPFARMAVDVHQRYARGQLPLELATPEPSAASAWFTGKVGFRVELPNYQAVSGQQVVYELEGARLVGFNNDYAAFVAYRMGSNPISLVVTSSATAVPSGGEEIHSKGLAFHFDVIDGLKVITWTDAGLTYALVSELAERGQQSCMVCHTGTKDRDFIEGLKPER